MISTIQLITWRPEAPPASRRRATDAIARACEHPHVRGHLVGTVLPGGWNGGDIAVHLTFDDEPELARWRASDAGQEMEDRLAETADIDWVWCGDGRGGARHPDLEHGIYRVLFLLVEPHATAEQVTQFESDVLGLADRIPEILNWRLSRTTASGGAQRWTHVWEQEFAAVDNIKREYVEHPYHWGHVDRWFDPEMPCRIVATTLCHSFMATKLSILAV